MTDLMIDIETLGTKPGSVILSISAVWFHIETGATGEQFDIHIDVNDSVKYGLIINTDTFLWWMKQDLEARKIAFCKDGFSLSNALETFTQWINTSCVKQNIVNPEIWANSPSFDLRLLEESFDVTGLELPWEFHHERCVRTLASLAPEIKKQTKFEGIPHYGIDDCKHQIKYCSKTYQTLKFVP